MSRQIVHEIATLYSHGWRHFNGCVDTAVYDTLPCGSTAQGKVPIPLVDGAQKTSPRRKQPVPCWLFRADAYLCLGCSSRCALTRPAGFQCSLELRYDTREEYTLSPQEMVHRLTQLNTKQVAYCLNISRAQVYYLISSGKLPRSKTEPLRVPASAVRELLQELE